MWGLRKKEGDDIRRMTEELKEQAEKGIHNRQPLPCIKCLGWVDADNPVCSKCKEAMDSETGVTPQLHGFLYTLVMDHLTIAEIDAAMNGVRKIKDKHYACGPLICEQQTNKQISEYTRKLAEELMCDSKQEKEQA